MAIRNKLFLQTSSGSIKTGQTKATEMVAWQCSYKKTPSELLHSRLFSFITPSVSRTLGAVHAQ